MIKAAIGNLVKAGEAQRNEAGLQANLFHLWPESSPNCFIIFFFKYFNLQSVLR